LNETRNLAIVARSTPKGEQATSSLNQITGVEQPPESFTKLSAFLNDFVADNNVSKDTVDATVTTVEEFDSDVGLSLEQLQSSAGKEAIQRWLKKKSDAGRWLAKSTGTVLSRFQGYWVWLHGQGKVPDKKGPFHGRRIPKGRDPAIPVEGRRGKGPAFKATDVPRIWQFAAEQWTHEEPFLECISPYMLSAFCKLSAFTGIRRGGVMKLKPDDVQTDPERGRRYIHAREKILKDSNAGDRPIPVHDEISDLVDELCAAARRRCAEDPKASPYLIHLDGVTKEENRLGYISKAFNTLIRQMGLRTAKGENIHSLRKNFSQAMKATGAEENIRKQIFGHKIKELIDDPNVYGNEFSVEQCYDQVISKLKYPGT
jgi:integrase